MSLLDCSANNTTLPELSKFGNSYNISQEEMEELILTNDMSVEEEIAYYSNKPVFGHEIHDEIAGIWSKLQDWQEYFGQRKRLEEYVKRVRKIILKIKSENIRTSEYYFGFEVDEVLEKALQTHFKESGHNYSHQIYDLKFAFNLYFYCCLQSDPELIAKYIDFINQIIMSVLRCKAGSRFRSLLSEHQVQKISKKLRRNDFKNKIFGWLSFLKR